MIAQYFSAAAIWSFVTVMLAGVIAVLTAMPKKDAGEVVHTNPALFHAGLVVCYASACYGLGGLCAFLGSVTSLKLGILFALIILAVCVAAHIYYAISTQVRDQRLRRVNMLEAENVALRETSSLGERLRSLGIDDAFQGITDERFLSDLRERLATARTATIVYPDEAARPNSSFHGLAAALSNSARNDFLCRLICPGLADPRQLAPGINLEAAPAAWGLAKESVFAAIVGDSVYFSLANAEDGLADAPIVSARISNHPNASFPRSVVHLINCVVDGADTSWVAARACSSPYAYNQVITDAEKSASRIDRVPKRISVLFKSIEAIHYIAQNRFGNGSPNIDIYVSEHTERQTAFFRALNSGMKCREIYNIAELANYASSRQHSGSVTLSADHLIDMLFRWREAILEYPQAYKVGFSTDPVPFKYQIVDRRMVILHEAIGSSDMHRLNAISISGETIAQQFEADFDTVWERIPIEMRSRNGVVDWIDGNLMSLI